MVRERLAGLHCHLKSKSAQNRGKRLSRMDVLRVLPEKLEGIPFLKSTW